jgi:hypothetical protein
MKVKFFRHSLETSSNIKFHENHPVAAQLFYADGRTDGQAGGLKGRHDEADNCFPQFCERS